MLGTAPSFPPIETWEKMSESEQDAVIQAIEISRRRRSRFLPMLFLALGAMIALVCCYAQLSSM